MNEEKELKINNPLTVLAAAIEKDSIEDVDSNGTATFCIGETANRILSDELGLTGYTFGIIIDIYYPNFNKISVCDEDSEEEPKIIPVSAQLTDSNRAVYQILLDRLVSLATQEFFERGYLWQK